MFLRKVTAILLPVLLFMAGCKKDKNTSDNTSLSPEDCIQSGAVGNGEVVAGRYIVAYKPSSVSARGMTAERLNTIGTNVLKRNSISEKALKAKFCGRTRRVHCGIIDRGSKHSSARMKISRRLNPTGSFH